MQMVNVECLSVLIPCYQNFDSIFETLDSLFYQDYSDIELVIGNDGSTFFSKETLETYIHLNKKDNIGNVVILDFKQNRGTVKLLNELFNNSHGNYIKLMGPGDLLSTPSALKILVSELRASKADVAIAQALCIKISNNNYYSEKFIQPSDNIMKVMMKSTSRSLYLMLLRENQINIVASIFTKSALKRVGGFDQHYCLMEDWPLWIKFSKTSFKFIWIPKIVCKYKLGGISNIKKTNISKSIFLQDLIVFYEREVLPEMYHFKFWGKREILFCYKKLNYYQNAGRVCKICFYLCYIDIIFKRKFNRMLNIMK